MNSELLKRPAPSAVKPSPPGLELAGAVTLTEWRKAAGVSRTTAFYWRRSGKLKVIYRYGHAYVSAEESRRLLAECSKES
jgi:hypothetical protein